MTPLLRLLLRAGWAPLAVLIFHQKIMRAPWRQQLDFVMHYSGGVAISFFIWHALDCFAHWFGSLTPFARYLFTFALACTVGLFWEFAELFSDVVFGSHIQHSVRETMRDLIADATGALTTLTLTWMVRCFTVKREAKADQPPASQV
ncbi:MAG: hypothetical protein WAW39_29840 [Prosthecobacter sp.]|uniref:hypothetical protein n=1 Tax=Prosthecobacter sp. TaxID=1965333 RepID=UPI003BB0E174